MPRNNNTHKKYFNAKEEKKVSSLPKKPTWLEVRSSLLFTDILWSLVFSQGKLQREDIKKKSIIRFNYLSDLSYEYPYKSFEGFVNSRDSIILCDKENHVLNFVMDDAVLIASQEDEFTGSTRFIFGKYNDNGHLYDFTYNLVMVMYNSSILKGILSKKIIFNVNAEDGIITYPKYRYFPMYLSQYFTEEDKEELKDYVLRLGKRTIEFSIVLMKHKGYYCPFLMLNKIHPKNDD